MYRNLRLGRMLAIIFTAVLLVNLLAAGVVLVEGESMEPAIRGGDLAVCQKIGYRLERGDVVIAFDGSSVIIKRILGLPGGTVFIDADGRIYVNGNATEWDCGVGSAFREDADFCGVDVVLGEDEYFLLGDNMDLSRDSRIFGPVKKSAILGKVLRVVEL